MSNHGNILPFPLTEKTAICETTLGTEFTLNHARGPITVRLCQLDLAAGTAVPLGKVFKGSTATGIPNHQVMPTTATADRVYGVGMTEEALVDNDYFFVQVEGVVSVFMGDDGTDTVIGELLAADNDTDTGTVYNTERLLAAQLYTDFAIALEVVTGTDAYVLAVLIRKLFG